MFIAFLDRWIDAKGPEIFAGQPTCAVVLKVVFDENEKKYED